MRRGLHAQSVVLIALVVSASRLARRRSRGHDAGMSLFGDLKYGPDFKHFDYVNPDAPKGGTMRLSAIGTFDTLNPFVVKGVPAAGIGRIFDTLAVASEDEPGSEYGLVAENDRARPRQALGALHVAQGSAVSRRHADDARGRRSGPSRLCATKGHPPTAPITAT